MDAIKNEFLTNQAKLDASMDYDQPKKCPAIYKLFADRHTQIPVRFLTGEMGMGDPFTFKFFRGIAMYGIGTAQIRVFVDHVPVSIYRPLGHPEYGTATTCGDIEMAETPDPQRVLWLPRGTKGRTINIEVSGNIKHIRSLIVFWDPLTGEEDG